MIFKDLQQGDVLIGSQVPIVFMLLSVTNERDNDGYITLWCGFTWLMSSPTSGRSWVSYGSHMINHEIDEAFLMLRAP